MTVRVDPGLRCRSCGRDALAGILSLGTTPLANSLLTVDEVGLPERRYPLDLALCTACSLVQITETVPPEELFGHYMYFSSFSDTMVSHARELAERLVAERCLGDNDLVVEIASNDGYLLQFYQLHGVQVLGIEPARNVAIAARERGIDTVVEFFGLALAQRLASEGRRANVLHAHNVLAHVADLNGFVEGMAAVLADDGVAIIEVPYLKDMLDRCEFDTIYHEHLCYFSVTALVELMARHDLEAMAVERLSIHGGSLRMMIRHAGVATPSPSVAAMRKQEEAWGVRSAVAYDGFCQRVETLRTELPALLHRLKASGRLAAYGAAAKGATLLNVCNIGRETLDFVVDRSTVKQGRYMPGVQLRIEPPEALVMEMPMFVLLLAWNLADEVIAQQEEYRRQGGRFVIPIPQPVLV
jgi:SAM-dependent methyltransferase